MAKRVLLETYGCTLNQADSDIMEGLLSGRGYVVVHDGSESYDYAVLNTCTVKRATEQKILNRIREMESLGDRLVVAGCMASANRDLVLKAAPRAKVLKTSMVGSICDIIEGEVADTGGSRIDKAGLVQGRGGTIARIPISEGCLSSCTFCETKLARGPLNSFGRDVILKAIERSVAAGAAEVELASQDTGAYGLDRHTNIAELAASAAEISGDFMIRIGMLNPEHIHRYFDELMEAYSSPKVYKFLHLPVQSGSDRVLRDMERRYTAEEFAVYCAEARRRVPGMHISTDVIVGYPTETEEDFCSTIDLLRRIMPETINISRFSTRPHARAGKLRQLKSETVKRRSVEISREARKIQMEIRSSQVGSVKKVLVTELEKTPAGRDASYQQISITSGRRVALGERADVLITGVTQACMLGSAL